MPITIIDIICTMEISFVNEQKSKTNPDEIKAIQKEWKFVLLLNNFEVEKKH